MKKVLFSLGMFLLAGCGKDVVRQPLVPRVAYPALNESPPPPPPPLSATDAQAQPSAEPEGPPAVIAGEGWVQRQVQMEDQVKRLREYAAKAGPGDPFALTEKEIEAYAKRDESVSY